MNNDHISSARKLVKTIAADYRLQADDNKLDLVARNTATFVMQQLGNLKKTMVGASIPPYVINAWSDISVKRRSIYGKPSTTTKGYESAIMLADSALIDLKLFCRSFPPDGVGAPHVSHMSVSDTVWKLDVKRGMTPAQERKMVGRFVAATYPEQRSRLLSAGEASEYTTSVAEIRERCLRKAKKDQMRAVVLPELQSPCGLTYSLKPVTAVDCFGMAELSQIISLFGEGSLTVLVAKKLLVFSNRYFTYIIEWR